MATILRLGDFVFSGFEIPEKIPFGGKQKIAVHELVGGGIIADAMGAISNRIEWSGLFMGITASNRARYVDGLRVAGNPLQLTWDGFSYIVLISDYRPEFDRSNNIPYTIELQVVEDLTRPITAIAPPGIDAAVSDDMEGIGAMVSSFGNPALSSAFSAARKAMAYIPAINQATGGALNSVLATLSETKAIANGLISNIYYNGTMTGAISVMQKVNELNKINNTIGRVEANINAANTGGRTITVASGSLYKIAADEYGDQSLWPVIARANGLTDPMISGIVTLKIPTKPNA